jgi:hypothetical protein
MQRKKKTAQSKLKIKSLIICDDVREERSGKEILIGVYAGAIVFPKFPARLPKLVFRIDVQILKKGVGPFIMQIRDQKDDLKLEVKGELPHQWPGDSGIFLFEVSPVDINEPAWMYVWAGFDDEMEKIGGIELREANDTDLKLPNMGSVKSKLI